MASIKDVAKLSGLTTATISKYVNGMRVKSANKIRIDEAIKQCNYKPNFLARGLKTNKTMTIGILLPTFNSRFYPPLVSLLERKLAEKGYNVLLCDYDNDASLENSKFDLLLSRKVDQIVAAPMNLDSSKVLLAREENVPVVFFDHTLRGFENSSVVINNFEISYQAVELLVSKGKRKILFLSAHNATYSMSERLNGCKQCLKDNGLTNSEFKILEIEGDSTSAYNIVLEELNNKYDALFALSSNNTLGAIMAISEKMLKVPDDISFIGFDNYQISRIFSPMLTYIEQPIEKIADSLIEIILKNASLINKNEPIAESVNLVVKAVLNVTKSI